MSGRTTIYDWRDDNPEFAKALRRANDMRADRCVDEVAEIAATTTPATVGSDWVRMAAAKWLAAICAPWRYGRRALAEDPAEAYQPMVIMPAVDILEDGTHLQAPSPGDEH